MVNCNECRHLNITEQEQHAIKAGVPHICLAYRTQVVHRSKRRGCHRFIYPCVECGWDDYAKFERRRR